MVSHAINIESNLDSYSVFNPILIHAWSFLLPHKPEELNMHVVFLYIFLMSPR